MVPPGETVGPVSPVLDGPVGQHLEGYASMKLDDGIKMPFVAITLYKATVSTSKICNGKRLDLSQRERR